MATIFAIPTMIAGVYGTTSSSCRAASALSEWHTGIRTWDGPPPLGSLESLLKANLGREILAIGDLDVIP
jgi:hypothetical protein